MVVKRLPLPQKQNHINDIIYSFLTFFFPQFTKQYNNLFAEAGVPPKRKLTRFLVTPEAAIEAGL